MNRIYNTFRKIAREALLKWRNESRYVLERKIFPKLKGKKVLLVGCAHYTKDYPKKLAYNDLWTIDIDPKMAEFGAKRHIIGNVVEINKYFSKNFFDVIFLTGVLGYGLNEVKDAEESMKNLYMVLKAKGRLVIQWSDIPGKNQINPQKLKNFKLFYQKEMFGYPSNYRTKNNKVWEFLIKNEI